jgi:hypothetical protein
MIGRVKYIDHEEPKEGLRKGNALLPLACKRASFQHEREVRLFLRPGWAPHPNSGPGVFTVPRPAHGENVEADIVTLTQRIVVSPTFPAWALKSLSSVVRAAGIDKDLELSDLLRECPS